MILPRRSFLFGLAGAFAAPAIVKASSLMQVKAPKLVMAWDVGTDDRMGVWFYAPPRGNQPWTHSVGWHHNVKKPAMAAGLVHSVSPDQFGL
jgi:hypothetical protein